MSEKKDLKWMFQVQREFSENFHTHDSLTDDDRERLTLQFAASLQKEVGDILSGINYRHHRSADKPPELSKIVHESVDAFRYLLGILNIWNIKAEDFIDAFDVRNLHLNERHNKEKIVWNGQSALIFDIDDVIVPFKEQCTKWVKNHTAFKIDESSKAYYSINEDMYMKFIEARQLKSMYSNQDVIEQINKLYDEGFWIQLLTARPQEHLVCKYDTYAWLQMSGLKYHRINFSPEKYLWLARTDYFREGKIVCAIDDSSKHALEYAKHGIPTISPRTSTNEELEGIENIRMYDSADVMYNFIKMQYNNFLEEKQNA